MFTLNSKLQSDTFFIADLKISQLVLMNNANYLCLILIPRKNNLIELTDLEFGDQIEVLKEINLLYKLLQNGFNPDKINIAALGNVVSQLHIHIIARKKNDQSFPKPVWCDSESQPYSTEAAQALIANIKTHLESLQNDK